MFHVNGNLRAKKLINISAPETLYACVTQKILITFLLRQLDNGELMKISYEKK